MELLIVCIAGLLWGSALTTLSLRDDLKSILYGRSKCPSCHKKLSWYELFPVFSFIFLRGRCHNCHKKIPIVHLIIELSAVILALMLYLKFGLNLNWVLYFFATSLLISASVKDIESHEVDLWIFVVGIVLAISARLYFKHDVTNILLAALVAGVVPFLLYAVSREKWMGLGDTFFAVWVGILSGFPAAGVAIFTAFLLGSAFGIIKLMISKKKDAVIPFGPFIAASSLVGIIWGQQIVDFYLKLIGY